MRYFVLFPWLLHLVVSYRSYTSNKNVLPRFNKYVKLSAGFGKSNKNDLKTPNDIQLSIKPHSDSMCKCGSGDFYGECCEKYHNQSEFPVYPERLVRSRFCAYALGNITYITETTHPNHKEYAAIEQSSKRKIWEKSLTGFITNYDFLSLQLLTQPSTVITTNTTNKSSLDINNQPTTSKVAFLAKVKRKSTENDTKIYPVEDINELSTFVKDKKGKRWLYAAGELNNVKSINKN